MASSDRTKWIGLFFISIAVALIIADSTIVNVIIPDIAGDIGLTSTEVQWVQEAYTLVFASFLLLFGALGDKVGRRRMLIIGVVIFTLSSLLAALAPTGEALIGARLIQGIGGAMILPATLSTLNATFRGRDRAIAFAVWGSTIGGMAAIGPLLGGWLATVFSWHAAFWINLPFGILIIVGILTYVQESKASQRRDLDYVGALLSIVLFGSLVFGLIEGRNFGWWGVNDNADFGNVDWTLEISPVPLAFGVTLLSIAAFIAWMRRRVSVGKDPLVDFRLFSIASFRSGNVVATVVSLGEFGLILSLPLWLQFVLGFDPLQTGGVLVALAVGSFVASGIAGAGAGKVTPTALVRTGLVLEIIGVVMTGLIIGPDATWQWLLVSLFIYGMGVGLATAQLTGVVLQDVPVQESGQSSGIQSTARQVGSALGVAILGTVLFTSTGSALVSELEDIGMPTEQAQEFSNVVVSSAGAAIAGLEADPATAEVAAIAKDAFSRGTQLSAWTAATFLVVGLAASFSLGSSRRPEDDEPPGEVDSAPASSGDDKA